MNDRECVAFLQRNLPRLGLRWAGFRKVRGQVCKRLARRLTALGLPDLPSYEAFLRAHAEEDPNLQRLCRVTISRFYRDRKVFELLRAQVLPEMAQDARRRRASHLRIWSIGSASGEEPYSLALIWRLAADCFPQDLRLEVLATDADAGLVSRARRALYPSGSLRELPAAWRELAFTPQGSLWCLRPEFRTGVHFDVQDVRAEFPRGAFDLVLCRNLVFTYFAEAIQRQVLRALGGQLLPSGLLIVGAHEALPEDSPGWHRDPRHPAFWRPGPDSRTDPVLPAGREDSMG